MSYYGTESDSECGCYVAHPLPWCLDGIVIPQLVSGAIYTVVISDNFGSKYIVENLVAAKAEVFLGKDDLPEGFLNPFKGVYRLEVFNELDLDTPVVFAFGANSYNCLLLSFVETTPAPSKVTIK